MTASKQKHHPPHHQASLPEPPVLFNDSSPIEPKSLMITGAVVVPDSEHQHSTWKSLAKDLRQIIFLLVLYTVQGVPMGLTASIPFLLQGRVSYKELGLFSLVSLPFSLKILWAPIVDSVYIKSVGRRKSWLIPVQVICALVMWYGSLPTAVNYWMGYDVAGESSESRHPANVWALLFYFGSLYFLMATQDVAVDGWSLTILSPENRPFSSACNAIGQTLGVALSYVGFLSLHDPGTCNRWFRSIPSNEGLITLGSFLRFWAYVILAATVCACFFHEAEENGNGNGDKSNGNESGPDDASNIEESRSVSDTYKLLLKMWTIPAIVELSIVLVTCRMAFGTIDAATQLKLVEAGMTKEELAFLSPFLLPVSLFCPMLIGKLTRGPRPLRWFLRGWRFRWCLTFIWLAIIPVTRSVHLYSKNNNAAALPAATPFWLYVIVFLVSTLHSISADMMFSSQMSFFARIADPEIGGTYMTLLNTVTNIGSKWPSTLALSTLDSFGSNFPLLDSFTSQSIVFSVAGLIWLKYFSHKVKALESSDESAWLVVKPTKEE